MERQQITGTLIDLDESRALGGLPPDREELFENCGRIFGKNAGSHRHAMVELPMIQHGEAGTHSARFGILRSVNKSTDACLNHGAATHGARFYGDVKSRAQQPIVSDYF
jgi:hypothetical protein